MGSPADWRGTDAKAHRLAVLAAMRTEPQTVRIRANKIQNDLVRPRYSTAVPNHVAVEAAFFRIFWIKAPDVCQIPRYQNMNARPSRASRTVDFSL